MKKVMLVPMALMFVILSRTPLFSHCEMPCGIYGDEMRFEMVGEHIATIEKSMKMIAELSKDKRKNYNQIVRWVMSKEEHADSVQDIVSQYFMTQRIKPVAEKNTKAYKKYVEKITLLHKMLLSAMKAKQTTDLDAVQKLKSLLESFRLAYFGKQVEKH